MPPTPFDLLAQAWSTQLHWRTEPTLWVIGSLVAGVLASNVYAAVVARDQPQTRRLRRSLETSQTVIWLAWLVLPGYAALLLGVASPRLMGLTQIDWGAPFGYGVAFAGLTLAVLLAAGVSYRRSAAAGPPWPSLAAAAAGSALLVAEAAALQWHWAFYRSAAIEVAAAAALAQPLAWGTWLGAGLAVVEGLANPLCRRDLRTPGLAERRVLRAVLLFATSVLFLVSRNFWLAWVLHATVAVLVQPRLVQAPATEPS